jgi:hypothetical protein
VDPGEEESSLFGLGGGELHLFPPPFPKFLSDADRKRLAISSWGRGYEIDSIDICITFFHDPGPDLFIDQKYETVEVERSAWEA